MIIADKHRKLFLLTRIAQVLMGLSLIATLVFLRGSFTTTALSSGILALIGMTIYYLSKHDQLTIGKHIFIISGIALFTSVPLLGIHNYVTMIGYAFLTIMTVFLVDDKRLKTFYIGLIICCTLVSIQLLVRLPKEVSGYIQTGGGLVITGLMMGIYFTAQTYMDQLKEYQEKLYKTSKNATAKNKRLNRYINHKMEKESFAYLSSHELRTPIRNISSFAGLIKERASDRLNEKEKEYLGHITQQCDYMSRQIEDLLSYYIISKEETHIEELDLKPFLTDHIKKHFADHKKYIHLDMDRSTVYSNEKLLDIMMKNIIENALNHSGAGENLKIDIRISTVDDHDILKISDNGIGIPDNMKEEVFLLFKRLDNKVDDKSTGIGLSLCKQIIAKHNGDIWASDSPGGGTTINIALPRH